MFKRLSLTTKKILSIITFFISFLIPGLAFAQDDPIGTIDKPQVVSNFDTAGNIGDDQIGILFFASRMVTYITIIAGIWAFANILLAGYTYITSTGNSQVHTQVRDRLTMSVMGMMLIVTVYAIAGILGTIFFGNSLYFINPTITGPGTP